MTATTNALWVIIACGALALVYGVWAIRSVLSADAGSALMSSRLGTIMPATFQFKDPNRLDGVLIGPRRLPLPVQSSLLFADTPHTDSRERTRFGVPRARFFHTKRCRCQ